MAASRQFINSLSTISRIIKPIPNSSSISTIRSFSTSPLRTPLRPTSTLSDVARPSSSKPLQKSNELKDELIPHQTICLVDPSTGSLLPSAKLKDILIQLDRSRFSILLVDPSHTPPICKILDKKEAYLKQQQKKEKAKAKAVEKEASPASHAGEPPKEVHLTWGVTRHDLNHKLAKGKDLLGKGYRVTVVLTDKKDAPVQRREVKDAVEKAVEEVFAEVGGKMKGKPKRRGMGQQVMLEFATN
ncbi:hypothetical protein T439DRAFT_73656 [Meredithblackwellia eburnea MCA 4105]